MTVLIRSGRVLLAHRRAERRWYPDCWDLVGGHLEAGESPEQAARRECREEIDVDVVELHPVEVGLDDPAVEAHAFLVTSWRGEPRNVAPEEHDAVGWFTTEELQGLRLADPSYLPWLTGLLSEHASHRLGDAQTRPAPDERFATYARPGPRDGSGEGAGRPVLFLMCGLPGAGKTTVARQIEDQTGAVRFSTDEWMADRGLDFYDQRRGEVQSSLDASWRPLLARGFSVILEDGTWRRSERESLREVAASVGASTVLHHFDVAFDELWRRLEIRNANQPYGAAPITRELLTDCWSSRIERPDPAELELFDDYVVHTT